MKSWKFWVGVAISALFLYLGLRGLHLGEVWSQVRQANLWWLLPAVLVYFVAVWARTWRWRYMLHPLKIISARQLFPAVVIGYMGNNIYPVRAGEFIRAYVLRAREAIPISASLATIVVERIFDGIIMLLFVFVALPFTPMPSGTQQVVLIGSLMFIGALVAFFVVAASPQRAERVYGWFIDRLLPERLRGPVRGFADKFMTGLGFLHSGREVLIVLGISLVIWLIETVFYWIVMHSFGFRVPFYVLMLMNGLMNLVSIVPLAPGNVGPFDTVGAGILMGWGVAGATAWAYIGLLHVTLWLPITLVGLFFMWRESMSWSDLGAAARAKTEGARTA